EMDMATAIATAKKVALERGDDTSGLNEVAVDVHGVWEVLFMNRADPETRAVFVRFRRESGELIDVRKLDRLFIKQAPVTAQISVDTSKGHVELTLRLKNTSQRVVLLCRAMICDHDRVAADVLHIVVEDGQILHRLRVVKTSCAP